MAADSCIGSMKDRPCRQQRLGREEVLLHRQQVGEHQDLWGRIIRPQERGNSTKPAQAPRHGHPRDPDAHPYRVFAHTERLSDVRTGPTRKRQQDGASPVRLAAITRTSQRHQRGTLLLARSNRGLTAHAAPLRNDEDSESYTYPLVNPAESA
jgi:hypothetical protein